jgi:hypothetical protein
MRYIIEKTLADGGHAIRAVHAKTHGILQSYLEVDSNLPGDLAQGLFTKPGVDITQHDQRSSSRMVPVASWVNWHKWRGGRLLWTPTRKSRLKL